jgi:hypothetical protein
MGAFSAETRIDAANFPAQAFRMAKKVAAKEPAAASRQKPSALVDIPSR